MLTLYHAPRSRSTRVIWLLEEMGAKYDLKHVSIKRPDGSGGPDKANPHPDKKVPALVHDGMLVTETTAICLYLTDLYPDTGLGPRNGDKHRGAYLTWLAYYAGVIEPVVTIDFAGMSANPVFSRLWGNRHDMDDRILGALKASPFILGAHFTAIDVLIASMAQWNRDLLVDDPVVDEYLKRVGERPALQRAAAKDRLPR
ncbi:MAG: glutathione S-transferase family protein [Hyphomonadaceae bacterium]|nr:glutathione S-transferase family protein [Hyphomonadaceae bacterium]